MPTKKPKDKILEIGADLIHRKGFNNTGLQEILRAAQVPKGSFYNYFRNKEDFGLQVIDFFIRHFASIAEDILENPASTPLVRIKNILDFFIEYFESENFSRGCPIGNLSQEMGDLSPAFRNALKKAIDCMVEAYAKILVEAKIAGEIPDNLNVQETAYFIVTGWHGALLHMKIVKNVTPLENHKKYVFEYLQRPEKADQGN